MIYRYVANRCYQRVARRGAIEFEPVCTCKSYLGKLRNSYNYYNGKNATIELCVDKLPSVHARRFENLFYQKPNIHILSVSISYVYTNIMTRLFTRQYFFSYELFINNLFCTRYQSSKHFIGTQVFLDILLKVINEKKKSQF